MRCEEVVAAIPDYLTGALEAASRTGVQAHMAECGRCRSEIEGLSETWARLRVLEDARPTPALRAGFYAMLEAYPRDEEETRPPVLARPWWRSWSGAWVLRPAAAALILVIGFALGRGSLGGGLVPAGSGRAGAGQETPLALISQPSAVERLEGISLAGKVDKPDAALVNALLDTVDNDPNVNVRLSAVESLFLFAQEAWVRERLSQSLGRQTSPVVQIALIDLLVASREKRAAEALARLIEDRQIRPEVREHAEASLRRLL